VLSGAASQQQTIDDQAKQIADLKAQVFELETDADPLNDKHTLAVQVSTHCQQNPPSKKVG
jgi:hypothetical protein